MFNVGKKAKAELNQRIDNLVEAVGRLSRTCEAASAGAQEAMRTAENACTLVRQTEKVEPYAIDGEALDRAAVRNVFIRGADLNATAPFGEPRMPVGGEVWRHAKGRLYTVSDLFTDRHSGQHVGFYEQESEDMANCICPLEDFLNEFTFHTPE